MRVVFGHIFGLGWGKWFGTSSGYFKGTFIEVIQSQIRETISQSEFIVSVSN